MQALTEVTSALDATCLVYVLLAFLAFALLGAPAFVDSHFLYTSTLLYSRSYFLAISGHGLPRQNKTFPLSVGTNPYKP